MFRFIVKRLKPDDDPKDYNWVEMSFFTRWTDKANVLVCFNTPKDFPPQFSDTLNACLGDTSATFQTPYLFHVLLLDALVPIYDQSIWDLSERMRKIEKVPTFETLTMFLKILTAIFYDIQKRERLTDESFPMLHEVARHTAHATETVQVAGNVIERMASECEALAERETDDDAEQAMYERLESLRMHHSMMLGVAARSISNEKRLSNEINLVKLTLPE